MAVPNHEENQRRRSIEEKLLGAEYRWITDKQLADLALASAREGANEALSKVSAAIGVNLQNEDKRDRLREDIEFLADLRETAKTAKHRFWLTFFTVVTGSGVVAVGVAIWDFVRAKL